MSKRAMASISLTRVDDGDAGNLSEIEELLYRLDDTVGARQNDYISVPFDEVAAPVFDSGMYYELVGDEYVALEEEPADWAESYTEYFLMKPFRSLIEIAEQREAEAEAMSEIVENLQQSVSGTELDLEGVKALLEDVKDTAFEDRAEMDIYRGFIAIDINAPSIVLGKRRGEELNEPPIWSTEVTDIGINLNNEGLPVGSFCSDGENGDISTLKADNARLSNIILRPAGVNLLGKLGIVAQSNGHVSLKEI